MRITEEDIKMLGIKFVDVDLKGEVIAIHGVVYNKIYNWAILDIDYCGG